MLISFRHRPFLGSLFLPAATLLVASLACDDVGPNDKSKSDGGAQPDGLIAGTADAPRSVVPDAPPNPQTTVADGGSDSVVAAATRPNILLIVADDLGYSDLGAFGGEISTPALDALAAEGRLLADHHAAATCSPTRSMLFSGTDHHLVGLGSMAELLAPEQKGKPGYEGYLNDRSLSIAQLLRDAGYHTYMSGKWHLGVEEAHSPKARGFESSFALLGGAGSHFAPVPGRAITADSAKYREDGAVTGVPEYFFSSNFFTDKLLSYVAKHKGDGVPFFAYLAFTAPHWPLQAPNDYIDRYKGKYDVGYDVIRQRRLERQKALGLIPAAFEASAALPSSPDNLKWEELSADDKKLEARKMEVYAAMVENLDHNVGRAIQYLKDIGEYENTFVFFQSDNGAEGAKGYPNDANVDNSLANIGRPLSNVHYGKRWAEVGATPFRLWKGYSTEGGVVVPAIARLPRGSAAQAQLKQLTHVSDVAPTLLELAGAANPGTKYRERDVHPITGRSLLPVLEGKALNHLPPGTVIADELFGRRYVRRDQWKLTWLEAPRGSGDWALYNLEQDRAESKDVSALQPQVLADLKLAWEAYVAKVGVVLPSVPGMPGRE